MTNMDKNLKILLIISGGIAAYKSLELIRILKKNNIKVQVILTKGGEKFITALSVADLTEEKVYQDLLTDITSANHVNAFASDFNLFFSFLQFVDQS